RRLDEGVTIRVGPLGVLLTRSLGGVGQGWLLSGTVNDNALLAAARDIATGVHVVVGQYP
ncbi:MAG: hypothetical protein ABWY33_01865, partial [Cellulomonas sp.]